MNLVLFRGSTHEADGATRMLVQLANELSARGHDVTVLRWKRRELTTFFPLNESIDLEHVRSSRSRHSLRHSRRNRGSLRVDSSPWEKAISCVCDPIGSVLLPGLEARPIAVRMPAASSLYYRLWRRHHHEVIRQYRRKLAALSPDAVVTFFTRAHHFVAEACKQLDIPVVCSMHSDPRAYPRRLGSEFEHLMAALPVSTITVLDESFRGVVPPTTADRIEVIPNWIDTDRFRSDPRSPGIKRAISVGRLIDVKNHQLLIEAWHLLAQDFPEWQLDIFGAGPQERRLLAQIDRFNLRGSVSIRPPTHTIEEEYAGSAIHVMPSYSEGFGLVLVEAMASGLPSVVLDVCEPPARMIRESGAGLVSPSQPSGLAESMGQLMDSEKLRRTMGARGAAYADRFSDQTVINRWEEHLEGVLASQ